MALTANRVAVSASPVALHAVGPTTLRVWNLGPATVLLGPTGAGNQKYPVEGGEEAVLTILASDTVFAITEPTSGPAATVAVFYTF